MCLAIVRLAHWELEWSHKGLEMDDSADDWLGELEELDDMAYLLPLMFGADLSLPLAE